MELRKSTPVLAGTAMPRVVAPQAATRQVLTADSGGKESPKTNDGAAPAIPMGVLIAMLKMNGKLFMLAGDPMPLGVKLVPKPPRITNPLPAVKARPNRGCRFPNSVGTLTVGLTPFCPATRTWPPANVLATIGSKLEMWL